MATLTNFNTDLILIRESVNKLTKDFEVQGQMAKTFQETFYRLGEMILELEEHFKQASETVLFWFCGSDFKRFLFLLRSLILCSKSSKWKRLTRNVSPLHLRMTTQCELSPSTT